MENARFVDPFVSVRAEEIALRLQQIRWQTRRAITVEVSERRRKRRDSDAIFDRGGDGDPPVVLRVFDNVSEIGVEQQIVQRGIAFVSVNDAIQKLCPNDATAAPDGGDVAEVQVPIVLFAGRAQQFHSLRVGNDLGGVKSVAHGIGQFFAIACKLFRLRLWKDFGRRDPFVFSRRDDAGFDRGINCRDNN